MEFLLYHVYYIILCHVILHVILCCVVLCYLVCVMSSHCYYAMLCCHVMLRCVVLSWVPSCYAVALQNLDMRRLDCYHIWLWCSLTAQKTRGALSVVAVISLDAPVANGPFLFAHKSLLTGHHPSNSSPSTRPHTRWKGGEGGCK